MRSVLLGMMVVVGAGPWGWANPRRGKSRPSPGRITTYRVGIWQETRDCLWNISAKKTVYGDPWKWKRIYQANQDRIEDPRVIFPKQVLVIPPE